MVNRSKLTQLTEEQFNKLTEDEVTDLLKGYYVRKHRNKTQVCFCIERVTYSDTYDLATLESGASQSILLEKKELYELIHNLSLVNSVLDGYSIYILSTEEPILGINGDLIDKIQTRFSELVMWCDENVMHNLPPSKQETLEWYLSDLEQLLKIERHE